MVSLKNQCFSSINSFHGDSGSGVFIYTGDEKYRLAGIITSGRGIKNLIKTPNHPLGYGDMQQTGAVFANRDPIENLIKRYIQENQPH